MCSRDTINDLGCGPVPERLEQLVHEADFLLMEHIRSDVKAIWTAVILGVAGARRWYAHLECGLYKLKRESDSVLNVCEVPGAGNRLAELQVRREIAEPEQVHDPDPPPGRAAEPPRDVKEQRAQSVRREGTAPSQRVRVG